MSNSKENNISFVEDIDKMIDDIKKIDISFIKDENIAKKQLDNFNEKIGFLEALKINNSNKNNEELKTILEDKGIKEKLLEIKETPEKIKFMEKKFEKIDNNDNKPEKVKEKEKSEFIENFLNTDISKQIKNILNGIKDLFKSEGFIELIKKNSIVDKENEKNKKQIEANLIVGSSVDNKEIFDKEINKLSDNILSEDKLNNIIKLSGISNNDKGKQNKETTKDKENDGIEKEKSDIKNAFTNTVKDGLKDPTVFTPQGFAIHFAKNYVSGKIKDMAKDGLDGGISKGIKEGFEKTGKEIAEGIKDTVTNFLNSQGQGTPVSFISLFAKVISEGNDKIDEINGITNTPKNGQTINTPTNKSRNLG